MELNIVDMELAIRTSLCADVRITRQGDGLLHVSTPFTFPDGDTYSIYLEALPAGGVRVTDLGGTLMHLSYDSEKMKLREGTRGRIFSQILSELDLVDDDGELFMDTSAETLGTTIFKFGQALTRVHDVTFLNRIRVESTFYDDLCEKLLLRFPPDRLEQNYCITTIESAENYPIDFFISGGQMPLYLFGVPNVDKARLTTIILQHLNSLNLAFRSIVVFQNASDIAPRDVSRLMNAANDMVSSLDAEDALERKLRAAVEA